MRFSLWYDGGTRVGISVLAMEFVFYAIEVFY